ncbi:hypothetical protein Tco_1289798 [Tanacetum coccineum]
MSSSYLVTYTSISSDSDGPSWGIPLMDVGKLLEMDPYEEMMIFQSRISLYLADASPTALSLGYVTDSDPDEDPKEDHDDYPDNRGDDDDEPIDDDEDDDDDDDDDEEQETLNKEEEHLAPADSSIVPTVDLVPSAEDTEAFETDESAPTPPPPAYHTTPRISI